MSFAKNNLIKLFILILFVLLLPYGAKAAVPDHIDISFSGKTVGQPTIIRVRTYHYTAPIVTFKVTVTHFGDGSPAEESQCEIQPTHPPKPYCDVSFTHTYSNTGDFVVTVESCDALRPTSSTDCLQSSARVNIVNAPVPAVCGNGIVETGEGCDDGNTVSGDGCDSNCQTEGGGAASGARDNPLRYNTFGELLDRIVGVIFFVSTMIAPAMIIIAGFLMIFSGANPANIALGRKIMLYTVVIFAIILIIKAMTYFFRGDLTFT